MLGHKTSLSKSERIETIVFSNHSEMKLEIHSRRRPERFTTWKLPEMANGQRKARHGGLLKLRC